jgi:hypothetical protein
MSKLIGSFDLSPEGQNRLAQEHEVLLEDCYVYHWFDLPDGRTIPDTYDLQKTGAAISATWTLKVSTF